MKRESLTENLAIFRRFAISQSRIHRITRQIRDKYSLRWSTWLASATHAAYARAAI